MTTNRYLIALVDGGGTVPVELAVVGRLVERGHDVTVLAEDSMEADVEATGAPNRPDRRPENDPYRDWECKSPRQLFARMLETQFVGPLRAYANDVGAAIAEHRPDLVVCSQFAFGAMVAAETEGVPFDVMLPNVYLFPFEGSTPALRMMSPSFSVSYLMNLRNASGPDATGSAPWSVKRCRTFGSLIASASAALSLSITGFGVPAGASIANHAPVT